MIRIIRLLFTAAGLCGFVLLTYHAYSIFAGTHLSGLLIPDIFFLFVLILICLPRIFTILHDLYLSILWAIYVGASEEDAFWADEDEDLY